MSLKEAANASSCVQFSHPKKEVDLHAEEVPLDPHFESLALESMKSDNKAQQQAFLLTFRQFGTPSQLYSIFKKYLEEQPDFSEKAYLFLQLWLDNACENEFSSKMVAQTLEMLQKQQLPHHNEIKLHLLKVNTRRPSTKNISLLRTTRSSSLSSESDAPKAPELLHIPTKQLANVLTMQEFEMFEYVKPIDFMAKIRWTGNYKSKHIHITKIIERFNKISTWVTTEIVSASDKKIQLEILQKFIQLARACDKLNNFNSTMEILAGLNNCAVLRLKELWESLPPKHAKTFEEMDNLMSVKQNYKNYTFELTQRTPPLLPYFGLFLRDFQVLSEGNPSRLPNGEVNKELIELVGGRAEAIQQFQMIPYKLDINKSIVRYLMCVHCIEDEELLYKLSLRLEPPSPFESPPISPTVLRNDEKSEFPGDEKAKPISPIPEWMQTKGISRKFRSSSASDIKKDFKNLIGL